MEGYTAVLVGGLARAGTTALVDVLNECADLAIMAEYRLVDLVQHLRPILAYETAVHQLASDYDPALRDVLTIPAALVNRVEQTVVDGEVPHYPGFVTPQRQSTLRYPTVAKFTEIVAGVVGTSLGKPGARFIGSKTPGTMLADADSELGEMFPGLRFIALLRSPMDQINSSMNRRNRTNLGCDFWDVETVEAAIAYYKATLAGLIALKHRHGDRVLFVKYEDLVHDSARTLGAVLSHIGVEWAPPSAMLVAERGALDVLTAEEKRSIRSELGVIEDGWGEAELTGVNPAGLALFNNILAPLPKELLAVSASEKPAFLVDGWSIPESAGIWTIANHAMLLFGPASSGERLLRLDIAPYLAGGASLDMRVMVNGQSLGRTIFCPGSGLISSSATENIIVTEYGRPVTVWVGPFALSDDAPNLFQLDFVGMRSPALVGDSSDSRQLGVQLSGIEFVDFT
jgi:hypothetical protein